MNAPFENALALDSCMGQVGSPCQNPKHRNKVVAKMDRMCSIGRKKHGKRTSQAKREAEAQLAEKRNSCASCGASFCDSVWAWELNPQITRGAKDGTMVRPKMKINSKAFAWWRDIGSKELYVCTSCRDQIIPCVNKDTTHPGKVVVAGHPVWLFSHVGAEAEPVVQHQEPQEPSSLKNWLAHVIENDHSQLHYERAAQGYAICAIHTTKPDLAACDSETRIMQWKDAHGFVLNGSAFATCPECSKYLPSSVQLEPIGIAVARALGRPIRESKPQQKRRGPGTSSKKKAKTQVKPRGSAGMTPEELEAAKIAKAERKADARADRAKRKAAKQNPQPKKDDGKKNKRGKGKNKK